ncbi:hypothetical protein PL8927_790103 [Planktothrix serta PCC 8927]|uniref:Uncharacterized protein n=1 Tax=Planktothrix serta PCC 8927 TaxID=671068 RepID=A0A7Z9BWE1_9CYAN|nr:hypothetical protein PL8927_790103 [Planktothrix serta PCC 8927]
MNSFQRANHDSTIPIVKNSEFCQTTQMRLAVTIAFLDHL